MNMNGNLCTFCPSPAIYNLTSATCGCFDKNAFFNGNSCVCQTPFILLETKECGLVCG
jgi:hypothetical protein